MVKSFKKSEISSKMRGTLFEKYIKSIDAMLQVLNGTDQYSNGYTVIKARIEAIKARGNQKRTKRTSFNGLE